MMLVVIKPEELRVTPTPKPINPVQVKLERYIGDKYLAEEIAKTKYPYIIAAIGKVESSYAPQIKGDSGKSWGMYQIQPRHWSWRGDGIKEQTQLCEYILHQLMAKNRSVEVAVSRYNGSGPRARAYAKRVLQIAKEIENG
jgi:hypothetical protein